MNSPEDSVQFADMVWLFSKNRQKLFKFFCAVFLFIFSFLILKPNLYKAQASFLYRSEGGGKNFLGNLEESLEGKLLMEALDQGSHSSKAISAMNSTTLLRAVVEKLGLQMRVYDSRLPLRILRRVKKNLQAEFNAFPKEDTQLLHFSDVEYLGEQPEKNYIKFLTPLEFEWLDINKKPVARGRCGEKLALENLQFVLNAPVHIQLNRLYTVKLLPWQIAVKQIAKKLIVKPSKTDANCLQLSFYHSNRHVAAQLLNQLMGEFKIYVECQHDLLASVEVQYLAQKERELEQQYQIALGEYTTYLKDNLLETGDAAFSDKKEMLDLPKQQYASRILDLDLEAKEWETLAQKNGFLQKHESLSGIREERQLAQVGQDLSFDNLESERGGLDLSTLRKLHGNAAEKRENLQLKIKYLKDLAVQLKLDQVHLSTLASVLTDPTSAEILKRAVQSTIVLQAESCHSIKEQERERQTLEEQKTLLLAHLNQMNHLNEQDLSATEKYLYELEQVALSLIKQEKQRLNSKLYEIREKMVDFPDGWQKEEALKLNKELLIQMIYGMSQIAQSKALAHKLFQVESKPLDPAFVPLFAEIPHLFLYPFLGASTCSVLLFFSMFAGQITKGFPLSIDRMTGGARRYLGKLRRDNQELCETLLADLTYYLAAKPAKKILIMGARGPHLENIKQRLTKLEKKLLHIDVHVGNKQNETQIISSGVVSSICRGEKSDALLLSKWDLLKLANANPDGLGQFFEQQTSIYDTLLFSFETAMDCFEIEMLLEIQEIIVLFLRNETESELQNVFRWQSQNEKRELIFIKYDESRNKTI